MDSSKQIFPTGNRVCLLWFTGREPEKERQGCVQGVCVKQICLSGCTGHGLLGKTEFSPS